MKPREYLGLVRQTADFWSDAKASTWGAAIAYYTLFSIAPLFVIVLAAAGLIFGPQAARGELKGEIEKTVGPKVAEGLQGVLDNASHPASGTLAIVIGSVLLLVGASGVFNELQGALNVIWNVEPKSGRGWRAIVRDRILSFAMVLVASFIMLASLAVTAVLAALSKYWTPASLPGGAYLWQAVNTGVSLAVITLLFAMIYKYLPDALIAWRDVWVGALTTAALFTLGKYLIGLYLGRSTTASAFGAAGSLAVVLVWVYYSAQIFLFGAAFTRVWAEHFGRGVRPAENADVAHHAGPVGKASATPQAAASVR